MLEEESILPFGRESVGGVGSRKSCEVLTKHKKLNMFQCNQQTWVLAVNNIKILTFKLPPSNLCGHCLNLSKFTGQGGGREKNEGKVWC